MVSPSHEYARPRGRNSRPRSKQNVGLRRGHGQLGFEELEQRLVLTTYVDFADWYGAYASEGGNHELLLYRSWDTGDGDWSTTVNYSLSNGTATAGDDFDGASGSVTFDPWQTEAFIYIPITADGLPEFDETFTVSLSGHGSNPITVTIMDGDPDPEVYFGDGANYYYRDVDEDAGTIDLEVNLSYESAKPITVYYSFDGTTGIAVSGDDFHPPSGAHTLTFAPGETSKTITVGIVDDSLDEDDEYFEVRLDSADYAYVNYWYNYGWAQVTILDEDDPPVVSFSEDQQVDEASIGTTFTVSLSAPSGKTITVEVGVADGTATGDDYGYMWELLTFEPGETSKQITVDIYDDELDEEDEETFVVSLFNPVNATLGDDEAVGTILDNDDPPTVTMWVADDGYIDETAPYLYVEFTLSAPSARVVTFQYATVDGTATSNEDYTPVSGTITFLPGDPLTQTIEVPILNDFLFEEDEQFTIELSNAEHVTWDELDGNEATITIVSDEVLLEITRDGQETVQEGDTEGNLEFTISRTGRKDEEIWVHVLFTAESSANFINYDEVDEEDPEGDYTIEEDANWSYYYSDEVGVHFLVRLGEDVESIDLPVTVLNDTEEERLYESLYVSVLGVESWPWERDQQSYVVAPATEDVYALIKDNDFATWTTSHNQILFAFDDDEDGLNGIYDKTSLSWAYDADKPSTIKVVDAPSERVEVLPNGAFMFDPRGLTPGSDVTFSVVVDGELATLDALHQSGAIKDYLENIKKNPASAQDIEEATKATIRIIITNEAPLAEADEYTEITHSQPFLVRFEDGVLANDSDPDEETLTAHLIEDASHGSVTLTSTGAFLYTPDKGYIGTDSFVYEARDQFGLAHQATVTLIVTNSDPTGSEVSYDVAHNSGVTFFGAEDGIIARGVEDGDEDLLTATIVSGHSLGDRIHVYANGAIDYKAPSGVGSSTGEVTETFQVSVSDGISSVIVDVTIVVGNHAPPEGSSDSYDVVHDTTLVVSAEEGLLSNDTTFGENDTDVLTVALVEGTQNGSLTLNSDGSFSYTPDDGFVGTDSFSYELSDGLETSAQPITVEINVTNTPAEAGGDSYEVGQGSQLAVLHWDGLASNDTDMDGDTLKVVLVQGPEFGSLQLFESGAFIYTHSAEHADDDTFYYVVQELSPSGTVVHESDWISVSIEVIAIENNLPAPESLELETTHGKAITGQLLTELADGDGDPVWVSDYWQPMNGTVEVSPGGSFIYTPQAGFVGEDMFEFWVTDGIGEAVSATVEITVTNSVPSGENRAFDILHGDTLIVGWQEGLLRDLSDAEGDVLTVQLVSGPSNGDFYLNEDGSFIYVPYSGSSGTDSFEVEVFDGVESGGIVVVQIEVSNGAPTAANDHYSMIARSTNGRSYGQHGSGSAAGGDMEFLESEALYIPYSAGVLQNDSDPDGDRIYVELVNDTSDGSLSLDATGGFIFTPYAGFVGTTSFTYRLIDESGEYSSNATVTIDVTNDAPVVLNDQYAIVTNNVLAVSAFDGIMANDHDAEADVLSLTLVSGVSNGQLSLSANGSFVYTPDAGFTGADSFTYRINDGWQDSGLGTVTIVVVEETYEFPGGSSQDSATFEDDHATLSSPSDWTLEYLGDGTYTATSYLDDHLLSAGTSSASATWTLEVSGQYEVFVTWDATAGGGAARYSVVSGSTTLGQEDVDQSVGPTQNLLHGGVYWQSLGIFSLSGTSTIELAETTTQSVVADAIRVVRRLASPEADSYAIAHDQTLVVRNNEGGLLDNDPLAGSLAGARIDSDVSHGTLHLGADGSFVYRPNAGFVGTDSFTYFLVDGLQQSTPATVTINVTNAAPASPQSHSFTARAGDSLEISWWQGLLSGAEDEEGDDLTAAIASGPQHGSLTVNNDGSFTYTPDAGFFGEDAFTYTITDALGQVSSAGSVSLSVPNTAPVVHQSTLQQSIVHDSLLVVDVTSGLRNNVRDDDGHDLTFEILAGQSVSHGTLDFYANGSYVYTPGAGFVGTDQFSYRVWDGYEHSSGTVEIVVTNALPSGRSLDLEVAHSGVLFVSAEQGLLRSFVDDDGDLLTPVLQSGPTMGSLDLMSNGSFIYTPTGSAVGQDSFTYTVTDGVASTGSITVTIELINTIPSIQNQTFDVHSQGALFVQAHEGMLKGVGLDGELDTLTLTVTSEPANGELEWNADGSFYYKPNNYIGVETIEFELTDGIATATGTITLNVSNAAPVGQADTYHMMQGDVLYVGMGNSQHLFPRGSTGEAAHVLKGGNVTTNDSDAEFNNVRLTASLVSDVTHGELEFRSDGSFAYLPSTDFTGVDTFTYKLSDGLSESDSITVSIHVKQPILVTKSDSYTTDWNTRLVVGEVNRGLLGNDGHVAASSIQTPVFSSLKLPKVVSWTIWKAGEEEEHDEDLEDLVFLDDNGAFTFLPIRGEAGTYIITYQVNDNLPGASQTMQGTATITVTTPQQFANEPTAPTGTPTAEQTKQYKDSLAAYNLHIAKKDDANAAGLKDFTERQEKYENAMLDLVEPQGESDRQDRWTYAQQLIDADKQSADSARQIHQSWATQDEQAAKTHWETVSTRTLAERDPLLDATRDLRDQVNGAMETYRGARQLLRCQAFKLANLGRRVKGLPGRFCRWRFSRPSSQSAAARICRMASAPWGLFQNISVPFTRQLISLTSDSIQAVVTGKPCRRYSG